MLMLLPVLTGLLLAASFPKISCGWIAWIAFIPLIAYVFRSQGPWRAFLGGWIAGVIHLSILLIWIPPVLGRYGGLTAWLSWTGYALLILALSCFSGAACWVAKKLMRWGGDSLLLLFPAVWVLSEFLQTKIPFGGFPWLLVGYSQTDFLTLAQVADLTGVYGVSFLVLWFGVAVFYAARHKIRTFPACWPLVSALLLVGICCVYGRVSLNRWDALQADHRAVILQGNLDPEDSSSVLEEKFFQGYARMSESVKPSRPDLLILPESPTPIVYQEDAGYRRMLRELSRGYAFGAVFNNIRIDREGGEFRYFNSAFFMDRNGDISGVYDKIHLVPFGEYVPMRNHVGFIKTITRDVGEFHPGRSYSIVKLEEIPVNAVICFEAIFPELVRRFVRDGSRAIINLTNDGWYGDSAAPYQHFRISRWRAIENRRYFLRAANTGISAVIAPSGRVEAETGILRQAVCEGGFAFVAQQTFYTRYGDVFVFLCAIIIFGFSIPACAGRRNKRRVVND